MQFKAVYPLSQRLATLSREAEVRELLPRAARHLTTLDGGAVAMADDLDTRYVVEAGFGWPADFLKREVSLDERTWASWVLRSAEEAYLLDNVAGHEDPMPILVLDEGSGRSESLLAVPLRARNRTLGALVLTGARGSFDASSRRVLEILANQGRPPSSSSRTTSSSGSSPSGTASPASTTGGPSGSCCSPRSPTRTDVPTAASAWSSSIDLH